MRAYHTVGQISSKGSPKRGIDIYQCPDCSALIPSNDMENKDRFLKSGIDIHNDWHAKLENHAHAGSFSTLMGQ